MAYEPWQPGMVLTANRLRSISPTWQSWTPEWDTMTGAAVPSFGDAELACRYAVSGTTCWGHFSVVFGSTTSFGTSPTTADNWLFSLPLSGASVQESIGWVEINQSTQHRVVCRMRMITTGDFGLETSSGSPDGTAVSAAGLVDAITPWNNGAGTPVGDWASGDAIRGTFVYELA